MNQTLTPSVQSPPQSAPSIVRAMTVRAFREFGRWAALLALAMGVGLAAVLYFNRPQSIVDALYVSVAVPIFFGAGLLTGLAILLTDLRRGHYAFALFRPVSRGRLFLAKFVAAALLYAAASSAAVVVVAVCAVQTRFTRSPFDISMLLPTLFFQLAGLPWIACGMLVAARRARWIGSRLFPVVVPVFASAIAMLWFDTFWAASLIALATTAVLLFLGAAYFTAGGEYAPLHPWVKPLAGAVVLVGGGALLVGVVATSSEMLTAALQTHRAYYQFDMYLIGDDGRPFRRSNDQFGHTQEFDLAGKVIAHKRNARGIIIDREDHISGGLTVVDPNDPAALYLRHRLRSFLTAENYLQRALGTSDGLTWHFVTARRTFEAYTEEGAYVGCLTPDGTFDTTGRRVAFPPSTRVAMSATGGNAQAYLLTDGSTVFQVDAQHRRVTEVYHSPTGVPMLDATMLYASFKANSDTVDIDDPRIAVATPGQLTIQSAKDGSGQQVIPLGPKTFLPYLNITLFGDRGVSLIIEGQRGSDETSTLLSLRDGVLTRETLPPLPAPVYQPRHWAQALPLTVAPGGLIVAGFVSRLWHGEAIGNMLSSLELWLVVGGTTLALLLTVLLARSYDLSRRTTLLWLGLAAIGGLHLPLLLVCLRERPLKVRCPTCGRRRAVNAEQCPHCRAAWPVPNDPATDVFEGERSAAA